MTKPLPLPALRAGHELCQDSRCQTCMSAHHELQCYIAQRTYLYKTNWEDLLGEYRQYLEKVRGIYCETEFGWADVRCFAEQNVHDFILYDLERSFDSDNMDDPSMKVLVDIRTTETEGQDE